MEMIRIEAGSYKRGSENGDLDEQPVHRVHISKPFYMASLQVTNAQYERFDPGHRSYRGKLGFSTEDDDAVVFVSWHEAVAYCKWLSEQEGQPYRLPTEAEWEYACRANTETNYSMGDTFSRSNYKLQRHSWYPDPVLTKKEFEVVSLKTGQFEPNPWGLYDMHGNVEEWTQDWYGPYESTEQIDPVGRIDGDFKVTRGGSHSTPVRYLRSSERMATLPEDKHWLIGFRVVMGDQPETEPLPVPAPAAYQMNVLQQRPAMKVKSTAPYFADPKVYVLLEASERGPFYKHNHNAALVEAPNGDLIAVWFTTDDEAGREMKLAASRLRYGAEQWDEASVFWDAPDRNMSGGALWNDGNGKLIHICGLGAAGTWGTIVQVQRESADNGVTWSKGKILYPEHGVRTMPIPTFFRMQSGALALACDAETVSYGGSALWLSDDNGESWYDTGGLIAGIHACIVQLLDGSLLALGRGDEYHDRMMMSRSWDEGKSWSYSESEFDKIAMGQRAVLRRLQEGPLFFASFAKNMLIQDRTGTQRRITGLFAAVSYDEGQSWSDKRLISTDKADEVWNGGAWTGEFKMDRSHAEPKGYLAMTQASDGWIHLISSRIHYTFNLEWIQQLSPGIE